MANRQELEARVLETGKNLEAAAYDHEKVTEFLGAWHELHWHYFDHDERDISV